jgi:hypothetical protein
MTEKGIIFGLILVCVGSEWMFVVIIQQCVCAQHSDSSEQPP